MDTNNETYNQQSIFVYFNAVIGLILAVPYTAIYLLEAVPFYFYGAFAFIWAILIAPLYSLVQFIVIIRRIIKKTGPWRNHAKALAIVILCLGLIAIGVNNEHLPSV